MEQITENFVSALERAKRQTRLSRAMFFEDIETMKEYTLEEILHVWDLIERIDLMDEYAK